MFFLRTVLGTAHLVPAITVNKQTVAAVVVTCRLILVMVKVMGVTGLVETMVLRRMVEVVTMVVTVVMVAMLRVVIPTWAVVLMTGGINHYLVTFHLCHLLFSLYLGYVLLCLNLGNVPCEGLLLVQAHMGC